MTTKRGVKRKAISKTINKPKSTSKKGLKRAKKLNTPKKKVKTNNVKDDKKISIKEEKKIDSPDEKKGFFGLFGKKKKVEENKNKVNDNKSDKLEENNKNKAKRSGSTEIRDVSNDVKPDKKKEINLDIERLKNKFGVKKNKKDGGAKVGLDDESDLDDNMDDDSAAQLQNEIKEKLKNLTVSKNSTMTTIESVNSNLNEKPDAVSKLAVKKAKNTGIKILDTYDFTCDDIPIKITISTKQGEFVPSYDISIANISINTEIILESIKKELIKEVNLGIADLLDREKSSYVEEKFSKTIHLLITKYFPYSDVKTIKFLTSYLIQKSLGMGKIEILMADVQLEEIVINSAHEPVWVYHRKYGWLKTNVLIKEEEQSRHYATMIGRKIGRQINVLNPLLDASLPTGDRVNATLLPISNFGNTMTIRKFAAKPWTITDLIRTKTITAEAASLIWLAMQYEMSALIAGGTGSGKTSTLNVISGFFPPNQRVISIEDTREIRLPKYLHWVPMMTRPANAEGRGEISMEHLLINSLRQRPDRIIVGEIRRKKEAEVLFEAMHTGHSTYATVHANTAEETVTRMTNPPIEIPETMLPALSLVIVQFRNRRLNLRRTLQIAEITPDAKARILMQYDMKKDKLVKVAESKYLMESLVMFTGFTKAEIKKSLNEKTKVLNYLVKQNLNSVDGVGRIVAEYYTNKNNLMKFVNSNKKFI